MVIKKHILANIKKLDQLYNSAPSEATYFSKLAIIELCGWIELTMDNIVKHFASKNLSTAPYQESFDSMVERNYGFDYKKNFRKMLMQTIGMHNTEKLELKVNSSGNIDVLKSNLTTLKNLRNDAAHTYIGTTTTYQSPSITKAQLEAIYPILKEISQEIKKIK
jgi:hypothetical protein